jgi:hypothetical protein
MRPHLHQLLYSEKLLTDPQYETIEAVESRRIISLATEIRLALYVGVLLLAAGLGILIYKNIGRMGHYLSVGLLFALAVACFFYVFRRKVPYQASKVDPPNAYYDYLVLLGCLLLLAIISYLQFLFDFSPHYLQYCALLTGLLFFAVAYRFDHTGVLLMGITALASFAGISIASQDVFSADFLHLPEVGWIGIVFSCALVGIAVFLELRATKTHFTFSYISFASFLYQASALKLLFDGHHLIIFLLILLAGSALSTYASIRFRSYFILIYSFIFAYIGLTYTIFSNSGAGIWMLYYFVISCGGVVYLIVRYRKIFKEEHEDSIPA